MSRVLGRVVGLFRYPVKSMAAEPLDTIEAGWNGFAGDRRWAFVRGGLERSGFPWLTIRENPSMWRYEPRFADPENPNGSVTLVKAPSGVEYDVVDADLAHELGHRSTVIKQDRGVFDAMPLSLISTNTIDALGKLIGLDLDRRRFRPNILIESIDGEDTPENAWVGETLQIGGMRMRVDKRDKRCMMINVDPVTTEKNPSVLRAVAQERQACLGVYGTIAQPGTISAGDAVTLD